MKVSPARKAAFDVLLRIETEKAFSSVLLPLHEERLSPADRGLTHQIVMGVLRRQIFLDKIIGSWTKGKLDAEVLVALRMGLFQLLFLDKVPAHAAINESVNLVQAAKKSSAKGLVNAVLRRATKEEFAFTPADEIERISVETSHPRWLIERWAKQFGIDETEKIAAANNEIPPAVFRVLGGRVPEGARPSEFVEGAFIAERVTPELLEMAERGEIYFQDEASQMVAAAVEPAERFLDVCAAPGSKTTQIARRFDGFTAAGDIYAPRVEFLRENCRKQGVGSVNVLQYNAERPLPFEEESFDTILIDAPCTGTGTIRHNPEIRYFLIESDPEELSNEQLAILRNASKLVRRGGKIVYSTCSLEQEENEGVVTRFLREKPDFAAVRPNVDERFAASGGFARTFPHRDGTDGFFIAALKRG